MNILKYKLKEIPKSIELNNTEMCELTYINHKEKDVIANVFKLIKNCYDKDKITEIRMLMRMMVDTRKFFIYIKINETDKEDEYSIIENDYFEIKKYPHIGSIAWIQHTTIIPQTISCEINQYIGNLAGLCTAIIRYDDPNNEIVICNIQDHLGSDILDISNNNRYTERLLATLSNIITIKKQSSD